MQFGSYADAINLLKALKEGAPSEHDAKVVDLCISAIEAGQQIEIMAFESWAKDAGIIMLTNLANPEDGIQ